MRRRSLRKKFAGKGIREKRNVLANYFEVRLKDVVLDWSYGKGDRFKIYENIDDSNSDYRYVVIFSEQEVENIVESETKKNLYSDFLVDVILNELTIEHWDDISDFINFDMVLDYVEKEADDEINKIIYGWFCDDEEDFDKGLNIFMKVIKENENMLIKTINFLKGKGFDISIKKYDNDKELFSEIYNIVKNNICEEEEDFAYELFHKVLKLDSEDVNWDFWRLIDDIRNDFLNKWAEDSYEEVIRYACRADALDAHGISYSIIYYEEFELAAMLVFHYIRGYWSDNMRYYVYDYNGEKYLIIHYEEY